MSLIIPLSARRRKKLQAKLDQDYDYRNYEDDDIIVKSGGPAGRGVFAQRQFTPGELIVEIKGQVHRKSAYEGSTYVMDLSEKWLLEPAIPGAFVNHSCNPNAELIVATKKSMALIAICNIEEGSQITFDYGWMAADWIPKCHCGAPNCRGWVVDQDEVEKMKKFEKKKKKKKKSR
ncbi:SET domain protein [Novipirellula aureliae]|uniref:SET domain protein n=1 Tax=Novipirellula aureliae TaxID=2527966 RepID=A0A5C6EDE1_9BACT|nr:SET domain-containing protein-lysine N-methyltransferase [Novipirellula aureliae]TWU45721.1 SET domain protein [Novipirellula aureliae]